MGSKDTNAVPASEPRLNALLARSREEVMVEWLMHLIKTGHPAIADAVGYIHAIMGETSKVPLTHTKGGTYRN